MNQIIYTVAIIKHNKKVLLVRPKDTTIYKLPMAVLSPNNQPQQSVRHAVQEAIGQSIEALQLTDVMTSSIAIDKQEVYVVYLASIGSPKKISLQSNYDRYEWVSMSELQQNIIDKRTRVILGISSKKPAQSSSKNDDLYTTNNVVKEIIIYTDGGSRGNPGPSAAGFVISNTQDETLYEGGVYLGITTNNQAEYQAVKLALERALLLGARQVQLRMDSLLVVNQMSGLYQIKNRDLWPIYTHIKDLIKKFEAVNFMHVRREFNQEADRLVNRVLDEYT
jgi:ribonuclease HI/ADP-ribose pyrophosphatase YjhB (NUDIX family)